MTYGVRFTRHSNSAETKKKRALYDPGTGTIYFQWVPVLVLGFSRSAFPCFRRILGQGDGRNQN